WVLEIPYDIRDEEINNLLKAYKTYFVAYKKKFKIKSENQAPQWTSIEERILSLDPGVRTFLTGYSPSEVTVE
ncbi:1582_t:CDS:2, partial [Gigaspora margarita]